MSFTATRKLHAWNFFFPVRFQSRTGQIGALVGAEIGRRCFIVSRWGFLNTTFIKHRLLPETNATAVLIKTGIQGRAIYRAAMQTHTCKRRQVFFRWHESCKETSSCLCTYGLFKHSFCFGPVCKKKWIPVHTKGVKKRKKKQILSLCRLSADVKHAKQRRGNFVDFIGKDVPKNENQVWVMRVAGLWSWVTSEY